MVESGQAPDLTGTETPYKFGYCTLVIAGAQRGAAACPGSNHPATLNFLLSRGAPVDSEDIVGYTALHHATQNTSGGALALARILLSSGANVNHRNRYGEVPILGAFQTNGVDAVELLMEFGADLDIADADGVDPRGFFVRTGPKVTAAVMKWLRKRNGEEKHMDAKKCDGCGNVDGVLKYCARCHAARYCSPVCQREYSILCGDILRILSARHRGTLVNAQADLPSVEHGQRRYRAADLSRRRVSPPHGRRYSSINGHQGRSYARETPSQCA